MSFARIARILLALAAALVVVWAFVDVGTRTVRGTDSKRRPVTLTILHWGDPAETDIVAKLVARYEAEHPDVRVQRLHTSNYDAKLKTMFASGSPPDVFYLRYHVVPEMASMGLLMDLEPHFARQRAAPGGAAWLDDFYPILLDAFRYDGTRTGAGPTYGLPKDCTTYVMYVNVDLFERAGVPVPYGGWTWDEYEDAAARITKLSTRQRKVSGGFINTWQEVLWDPLESTCRHASLSIL